MVLPIWVDAIFMGNSSTEHCNTFMKAFKERFRVKDLGPLKQALGVSVCQSLSEGYGLCVLLPREVHLRPGPQV